MTTVTACMNFCDKTHRVTVNRRDDGNFDVIIKSDCGFVQEYARLLTRITVEDLTGNRISSITDPEKLKFIMGPAFAQRRVQRGLAGGGDVLQEPCQESGGKRGFVRRPVTLTSWV